MILQSPYEVVEVKSSNKTETLPDIIIGCSNSNQNSSLIVRKTNSQFNLSIAALLTVLRNKLQDHLQRKEYKLCPKQP